MKVSIITVCFNSEKTIERAIQSVVAQTYANIEYIIIDGGSTDKTLDIIADYSGNIAFLESKSDLGIYHAMNKGIRYSTGDLVGILNSDDEFFSENTISDVVSFHEKYSEIDASIGNIIQCGASGKTLRFYSSKFWLPRKLYLGSMPPHPSIFFKRDLFNKLGLYNLSLKIASDYELVIRYFLIAKIKWKYSGLTTTRMNIGGVSSSGLSSYKVISTEIQRALKINQVRYIPFVINLRIIWKLFGFLKWKIYLPTFLFTG